MKRNQNFLTCSMLQVYICARNTIHAVQNLYQNDDFIERTYDTLTKWKVKKAWKTRNHAGGCHYLFFISQVWIEKLLKIWQDSVIRTNAVILETMMERLRLAQIRDCYLDQWSPTEISNRVHLRSADWHMKWWLYYII